MPGITLGNATSEIIKSPWLAFAGCAIPALVGGNPGRVTLALDSASGWKTPDATENPNAFFIGCTSKGWQGQGQGNVEQEFCDEFTTPIFITKDQTQFVYEADLLSIWNEVNLTALFGLEALHTGPDAFRHFRLPAGGDAPEVSFLLVTRRLVSSVYKYKYIFAPRAKQTASFGEGNFTRAEAFKNKVRMEFQGYETWGGVPFTVYEEE